jgi:hypothetical protein
MTPTLDQRVLDLIRARRVVKANDLAFWTGCDPTPSINRLERTGHIEHVGPGEPHQHWRAVSMMEAY